MDMRQRALRVKNRAFHTFSEAHLTCERRRHSSGAVPDSWLVRLAELQGDYAEAVLLVRDCVATAGAVALDALDTGKNDTK